MEIKGLCEVYDALQLSSLILGGHHHPLKKKQIKQQKIPHQTTTISTTKPKSPDSKSLEAVATDIQPGLTIFFC